MTFLGTLTDRPEPILAFFQTHDTAAALALIFAFAGVVFFAPMVTK